MPGGPSPIMTGLVLCMSAIYNRGKESFFIFIEITLLGSVLIFWLCVCLSEREREREELDYKLLLMKNLQFNWVFFYNIIYYNYDIIIVGNTNI